MTQKGFSMDDFKISEEAKKSIQRLKEIQT
jgi:hypothetical protein